MVTRERSYACIHPLTYKYFVGRDAIATVWERLAARYGEVQRNSAFGVMEIRAPRFWIRAIWGGNPITVIRRRGCDSDDVRELHEIIGYLDADADARESA